MVIADKDAWTEDVEFGRQVLAGMNPIVIEALKTFPPYKDMAATAEMVQPHLEGLTVQEVSSTDSNRGARCSTTLT